MTRKSAKALIKHVSFVQDELLAICYKDGRTLYVPLEWYPLLDLATDAQRMDYVLIGEGTGILWDSIGEALSAEGFLRGLAQPRLET